MGSRSIGRSLFSAAALIILSSVQVNGQVTFPLKTPIRPTAFPLKRPTDVGIPLVWGDASSGQIAIPPSAINIVQVVVGGGRVVALKKDGTLIGWGAAPAPDRWVNLVQVSMGPFGGLCAITTFGDVLCEGTQYSGEHEVSKPGNLNNVVQIDVGYATTAALRSDGTVVVWGRNEFGECDVPSRLGNVVQVAAANGATAALRSDGTVVAWGYNGHDRITTASSIENAVSIAADGGHFIVLKNDGSVIAWGQNDVGQTSVPPELLHVIKIAAGYDEGVALNANGVVSVWGYGFHGQKNIPYSIYRAIQIDAGYGNVAALIAQPVTNVAAGSKVRRNVRRNPRATRRGSGNYCVCAAGRFVSPLNIKVSISSSRCLRGVASPRRTSPCLRPQAFGRCQYFW